MTNKVLVLNTGGTIGMQSSADGFIPMTGFDKYCLNVLAANDTSLASDIDFISLDSLIDSADLLPKNWTMIGKKLEQLWDQYVGFVVLHGTDTMAYTASALSFMFQGISKPIVVTGSQIPLSEPESDGYDNLSNAVRLAADGRITEVCICFNGMVLRGNRSTKVKSTELDAFNSPNFPQLGHIQKQIDIDENLLLSIKKETVLFLM